MSEIDWARVEEYAKRLEEYDRHKAAKAKVFNVKELVADARKIRSFYDEDLNRRVQYGVLTFDDLIEIAREAKTNEDRSALILFKMLKKADPDLTLEDVHKLPLEVFSRLLTKLSTDASFLRMRKQLETGSTATPTRN